MECFKCGVSGSNVRLSDVISSEGIVKVCENCFSEDMPVVRKPTMLQLKESGVGQKKGQSVYERLSQMSGIKNQGIKKSALLEKQEVILKNMANRNFEMSLSESIEKVDLVENFHWIIMRVRRLKHLTQSQFAKEILESEAAIKAIEKGILPKNNSKLIRKIENHLGVKLVKSSLGMEKSFDDEVRIVEDEFIQGVKDDKIKFDEVVTKTLTISNLQEMKNKREKEIFENSGEKDFVFNKNLGLVKNKETLPEFVDKNKTDLSNDEINKIIFRGK